MKTIIITISLSIALLLSQILSAKNSDEVACPQWMNQDFRQLHSTNTINLCDIFTGKPLLIVNTASHCGFTGQFSGLEELHQKYKDKGFNVVGFSSNDFNQEAKNEEKAASICYENFGVTFTMVAPTSVKGSKANPVFKTLAQKSTEPNWNFNKFLVSADGMAVEHFSSRTSPTSKELALAINKMLRDE